MSLQHRFTIHQPPQERVSRIENRQPDEKYSAHVPATGSRCAASAASVASRYPRNALPMSPIKMTICAVCRRGRRTSNETHAYQRGHERGEHQQKEPMVMGIKMSLTPRSQVIAGLGCRSVALLSIAGAAGGAAVSTVGEYSGISAERRRMTWDGLAVGESREVSSSHRRI